MGKTYDKLYGQCERAGKCIDTCGFCKFINPNQEPSYAASNQASSYKQKKALGRILPPDTESIQVGYKEPLKPVENGWGYFGTLSIDKKREVYVQCHECGFFFKELGNHLRGHDLSGREYKAKYGLSVGTVLMTATSRKEFGFKRPNNYTPEHLQQAAKAREKALEAIMDSDNIGKSSYQLEYYNKFGICPDQIVDKYMTLFEELGRPPSYREMTQRFNSGLPRLLMRLFGGSWREVKEEMGKLTKQQAVKPN